jgi:hypothetical protein
MTSSVARWPWWLSRAALQDSACSSAAFYGTVRRASARLSVMVKMDPKIAAAIAAIG